MCVSALHTTFLVPSSIQPVNLFPSPHVPPVLHHQLRLRFNPVLGALGVHDGPHAAAHVGDVQHRLVVNNGGVQ